MLVFIDESGDPGFKIAKGSSPILVLGMVIFEDHHIASVTGEAILKLRDKLRVHPEFKFAKCRDEIRTAFFATVCPYPFKVRAIVVEKDIIYSPRLRERKHDFYRYLIRMMVKHDGRILQDAKVVIDGSGDRSFRNDLKTYLGRVSEGTRIRELCFRDSRRDPLLQLADMSVGAIARAHRVERKNPDTWKQMLQSAGRIDDIWIFS